MKPVKFPEVNMTFAEDQPEYTPLPGYKDPGPSGEFIFCMKLSFLERIRVLFLGKIWCSLLTFNRPLTPSFHTTKKSDVLIQEEWSWFAFLERPWKNFTSSKRSPAE